ncbi:hypothetical protein FRC18_000139 [Serendipita sp. 400]|nr:hypothetical protein FRC18_000139 [Serendipita sp. 400]
MRACHFSIDEPELIRHSGRVVRVLVGRSRFKGRGRGRKAKNKGSRRHVTPRHNLLYYLGSIIKTNKTSKYLANALPTRQTFSPFTKYTGHFSRQNMHVVITLMKTT